MTTVCDIDSINNRAIFIMVIFVIFALGLIYQKQKEQYAECKKLLQETNAKIELIVERNK